jgi:hypothetical protein
MNGWNEFAVEHPHFGPGSYKVWDGEDVIDAKWNGQYFETADKGVQISDVSHWTPDPNCPHAQRRLARRREIAEAQMKLI